MTHSRQCVKNKKVTYKEEYQKIANDKTREVEMYKRKVASLEDNLKDANHWVEVYQERMIEEVQKGKTNKVKLFTCTLWLGMVIGASVASIFYKLIG